MTSAGFACDYCVNVMNDAIDGSCPAVCYNTDADAGCNAHTECSNRGGAGRYCDR